MDKAIRQNIDRRALLKGASAADLVRLGAMPGSAVAS